MLGKRRVIRVGSETTESRDTMHPFGPDNDHVFVYLSPFLEKKSQREVNYTVAHEFAHVALGHYKPGAMGHPAGAVIERHEDAPTEQDADRLTESWGFPCPKPAKRKRGKP